MWAFRQPVPAGPKVVLLAVANNANKNGENAYPSLKLLEENCAPMGKRMIQRYLRWLEQAKLVSIVPRHTDSGRQTSNCYLLHMTTTYCGEGVRNDALPQKAKSNMDHVGNDMGRVSRVTPSRVTQLCQGEGVIAMTPSDKNLDPVSEPKERIAGDEGTSLRRLAKSAATWEGYRKGYYKRYGIDPVRDARMNVDLCRLVDCLGSEEAPAVAEFYVSLEKPLYLQAGHPTTLLLRDYQVLRTQWKTRVIRAPVVGPKAFQPAPPVEKTLAECPPEAAAALSKILGRDAFSFSTDRKGSA
ncbi:MAG: hypothetical protein A4E19_05935 [Nitrospira sp. SG-bin1]|nr:MAG: hypothetical protein A4E19_05935 [Nitrospira sp. SG-bin1]